MKDYYLKRNIPKAFVFATPIDLTNINEAKPTVTELPCKPLKIVYTGSVYACAVRFFDSKNLSEQFCNMMDTVVVSTKKRGLTKK